jgi:hypothetical protein
MDYVVSLLTVIGDTIQFFQLMHQEDICNTIGEVPYLEVSIRAPLVCHHRPGIAIYFDAALHSAYSLQVLVTLEGSNCGASVEICPVIW